MVEISASLLNLEKENANRKLYDLEVAKIDYFHIDVMDGKFVPNNTTTLMKDYALTITHISNLGLDVHLMVQDIESYVDEYLDLNPKIITFHIEESKDDKRTFDIINKIKENGAKVGIAISPNTEIEKIKKYLNHIHLVLVMTVEPGYGKQKLLSSTLEKIKELKKYIDENNISIDIEADGGINENTVEDVILAGANILVVGSYLIYSDNYVETVKKLKSLD